MHAQFSGLHLSNKFKNGALFAAAALAYLLAATFALADQVVSAPVGSKVTISATAAGSTPFSYQWRKNGVDISLANSASHVINNAQTGDSGDYTALISNSAGSTTTDVAKLTVSVSAIAPTISGHPSGQTVATGATATFTASAVGTPAPTFQWQKNGVNLINGGKISGATSASLSVTNAAGSDGGIYTVVASNSAGSVTSNGATLIVTPPSVAPTITTQPIPQSALPGSSVTYSVVATGTPTLTFQWSKNGISLNDGTNINGSDTDTLSISNVSAADAANYSVVVVNSVGSATSSSASLTITSVTSAPTISVQPIPQAVVVGDTVNFSVVATGTPSPGYQWYRNGAALADGGGVSGANQPTLTLTSVSQGIQGDYTVVVSNGINPSATSNPAELVVALPSSSPVFTTQPLGQAVLTGSTVVLTSDASGIPSPSFQWQKNGVNLTNNTVVSGATTSTLTLTSVAPTDSGTYSVLAVNTVASVSSNNAIVTVSNPPPANQAPVFTVQPISQSVAAGSSVSFLGAAAALPAASYQWKKDGVDLVNAGSASGVNTQTLTINNLTAADAGSYSVVATNILGTATSNGATLVVRINQAPTITKQPVDQTANLGSAAFFSVDISGFPDPVFQWKKNGVDLVNGGSILGAKSRTLSISNVTLGDAAPYTVVVSNAFDSVTSTSATLTVTTTPAVGAPAISNQPPPSSVVSAGTILQLSVTVVGDPAPTLQWRKDGANLSNGGIVSGVTSSTLKFNGVTAADSGKYSIVATNSQGTAISSIFEITVLSGNVANQTVTLGKNVALFAPTAAGSVQWQVSADSGGTWTNLANDSTYDGVTSNTLHIAAASTALNSHIYRLVSGAGSNPTVLYSAKLNVTAAFVPHPVGVTADGSGNLYVADASNDTIEKINTSSYISTLAGTAGQTGTTNGTGTAARFNDPTGVVAAFDGSLAVTDKANATIRIISPTGVVTTLAGSTTLRGNVDGTGTAATFSSPSGIARDSGGNFYVADAMNHTIRKVTSTGVVTTLAGSAGLAGSADGVGSAARFNNPTGLDVDAGGNLFVADTTNNLIRKVTPTGTVTTLAGLAGVSGITDGTGANALFNLPSGVAADNLGNIYVADTGSSTVRRITSAGLVTTIAGLPGISGHKDGAGVNAWFNQPRDVAVSSTGHLYVADTGNASIRRIDQTGTVTTVALTTAPSTENPPTEPLPPPPTLPPTPTLPTLPSNPTPPSQGSSGGGGGAPSLWFGSALAALALMRRMLGRRA